MFGMKRDRARGTAQSRLVVCEGGIDSHNRRHGRCAALYNGACTVCGCMVKVKAKKASERCPLGKW